MDCIYRMGDLCTKGSDGITFDTCLEQNCEYWKDEEDYEEV